jgi:hypothetical protein
VTLRHRTLAFLAGLLPLAFAGVDGCNLGFTMYAESVEFRLEITARDASGAGRTINPAALAPHLTPSAVPFFAGSDHFRRTYGQPPLLHHLREAGRLTCAADPNHPATVEVTLVERRRRGVRETRERVPCDV